jgi:hypothetical protein
MPRLPCRDIDFFIAAISIFSSPRYRFFFAGITIFSPARYRFFSSSRYRFFRPITAIFIWPYSRAPSRQYSFGLTAAPHHGDIPSALQPRPITAIFIRPYSRAPSWRYSFGLTAAPHHGDIPLALQPRSSPYYSLLRESNIPCACPIAISLILGERRS